MAARNGGIARWQVVISVAAGGAAFIGFAYTVVSSIVTVSIQQNLQIERNAEFYRRMDTMRQDIENLKVKDAQQKAALIEIETQFCAGDAARNLTHASDLRLIAAIYEKVFGSSLPVGNSYYAQTCNRTSR